MRGRYHYHPPRMLSQDMAIGLPKPPRKTAKTPIYEVVRLKPRRHAVEDCEGPYQGTQLYPDIFNANQDYSRSRQDQSRRHRLSNS